MEKKKRGYIGQKKKKGGLIWKKRKRIYWSKEKKRRTPIFFGGRSERKERILRRAREEKRGRHAKRERTLGIRHDILTVLSPTFKANAHHAQPTQNYPKKSPTFVITMLHASHLLPQMCPHCAYNLVATMRHHAPP